MQFILAILGGGICSLPCTIIYFLWVYCTWSDMWFIHVGYWTLLLLVLLLVGLKDSDKPLHENSDHQEEPERHETEDEYFDRMAREREQGKKIVYYNDLLTEEERNEPI